MGKKKPQKTKEISIAIAEASSSVIDVKEQQKEQQFQEQQPQQGPRKRGRPRKILVEMEKSGEKKLSQEQILEQEEAYSLGVEAKGMDIISSVEEEKCKDYNKEKEKNEGSSSKSCIVTIGTKQEQVPKGLVPSRSRSRRKSKPRKSS